MSGSWMDALPSVAAPPGMALPATARAGTPPPQGSTPPANWMDALPSVQAPPGMQMPASRSSAPKTTPAPAEPKSSLSGIMANIPAGLYRGVADLANLPNHMVNAGLDLLSTAGVPHLPPHFQDIVNPNPLNVPANGTWERAVNTAASAVPSILASGPIGEAVEAAAPLAGPAAAPVQMVGKAIAETPMKANVVAPMALGAGVGQAAAEHVPAPVAPLVDMVGNLAGGIGGATLADAAGRTFAAPGRFLGRAGVGFKQSIPGVTDSEGNPLRFTQGQLAGAAAKVGSAAGPAYSDFVEGLEQPGSQVPGVQRTTAEQSPAPGVVNLDSAYKSAYPTEFNARNQQNGAALARSVQSVAPGGNPQSVGKWFTGQLDALNAANDAEATALRHDVTDQQAAAGGTGTPAGYGAQIAPAIEATQEAARAPVAASADQAQAVRDQAVAGLPAGREPIPAGATVPEQVGADARGQALAARSAEADRLAALKAAINPEGDAGTFSRPFVSDVRDIYAKITPSAAPLSGDESGIVKTIKAWPEIVPINDIIDMQQRVNGAIRSETGVTGAQTPVSARLAQVKTALDANFERMLDNQTATEQAAVASGQLAPEDTILGRISRGSPQDAASQTLGTAPQGPDRVLAGTVPATPTTSRTASQGTADAAGRGSGSRGGDSSLQAGPATQVGRKPQSIIDFAIARGGVQDPGGDLRAMDLHLIHHQRGGRLINPNGEHPDDLLQAAKAEAFTGIGQHSDINDLYDALGATARGNPIYRAHEQAEADLWQRAASDADLNREAYSNAASAVSDVEDDAGLHLTQAEHDHASQLVAEQGLHPEEAVRQVLGAGDDAAFQRNAERNAIGSPGVPIAAQQADNGLSRPSQPMRMLSRDEQRQYQNWRQQYAQFKQTYDTGLPNDILQRGEYKSGAQVPGSERAQRRLNGGFNVQDADVMNRIWNGKGTEAANLRAAQDAGITPETLISHAADDLRGVALKDDGEFDLKAYAKWRRSHAAGLHVFPEVATAFDGAAAAQRTLEARRADLAAVDAAHPLKGIQFHSEIPGRYLQAGDTGADMARQFVRDTGGDKAAGRAFDDSIIHRMRAENVVQPDGTIDAKRLSAFRQRYSGALSQRDDVIRKLSSLATAQNALDEATARHVQQVQDFQNGVAKNFLNDDPHTAIRKAFGSGNPERTFQKLVDAVKGDPDAAAGLKRAVADFITDRMSSTRPADKDVDFLKAAEFRKWINANKAPLRIVFGGQGIQNLEMVGAELRRQAFRAEAAAGSPTTQRLIGAEKAGLRQHGENGAPLLWGLLGERVSKVPGVGFGIAASAKLISSLKQAGVRTQNDLVKNMLLKPDFAAAALKATRASGTPTPALQKRLATIVQTGLINDEMRKEQRE